MKPVGPVDVIGPREVGLQDLLEEKSPPDAAHPCKEWNARCSGSMVSMMGALILIIVKISL